MLRVVWTRGSCAKRQAIPEATGVLRATLQEGPRGEAVAPLWRLPTRLPTRPPNGADAAASLTLQAAYKALADATAVIVAKES